MSAAQHQVKAVELRKAAAQRRERFDHLPAIFGEIFAGNMVAGVFVVGLIMELLLPKDPAKYEAFMESMDEKLDMVDIDPALFYEHDKEEDSKK